MKYSQNSKIMQISEKTLIIGVDIASEVHFARAFDYRGVELAKISGSLMMSLASRNLQHGLKK